MQAENTTNQNTSQDQPVSAKTLLDRAKIPTEHKDPGQTAGQGAGAQGSGAHQASQFWSREPEKPAQQQQQAAAQQEQPQKDPLFTKERARASAAITVMGIDNLQRLIFTVLENLRFKNKFKEHEIRQIDKKNLVDYVKASDLPHDMPSEDRQLWSKWNSLYKRHEIKLGKIPMEEKETHNMEQMLTAMQEYNQKLLSPGWGVSISIANLLARRAMDIYMED